ncbi:ZNF697 [Cervus elaphus hippelaphus]|uniref:ZNF697 n=1 Tax=Cervus elaphus hippelaphus TaxID=46360 RepID=A0A212CFI9_CEREH|nr:ZNF697 [Cervus elaphus hippelaphus]
MEQEDKQGVCEAQDSQDKGMGSDFENCEDREGDPDERGMGSNPQDADKREGHLEREMGSNPQDEALRGRSEDRELMSNICTEGLLSEEDGVAGPEEKEDQSGHFPEPPGRGGRGERRGEPARGGRGAAAPRLGTGATSLPTAVSAASTTPCPWTSASSTA